MATDQKQSQPVVETSHARLSCPSPSMIPSFPTREANGSLRTSASGFYSRYSFKLVCSTELYRMSLQDHDSAVHQCLSWCSTPKKPCPPTHLQRSPLHVSSGSRTTADRHSLYTCRWPVAIPRFYPTVDRYCTAYSVPPGQGEEARGTSSVRTPSSDTGPAILARVMATWPRLHRDWSHLK